MMEHNGHDKRLNNRRRNMQEFIKDDPFSIGMYHQLDAESNKGRIQKVTIVKLLLFVLQIAALILLLLYLYKMPFADAEKGKGMKGTSVSDKS